MKFKRSIVVIVCVFIFAALALGSNSSGGSSSSEAGTSVKKDDKASNSIKQSNTVTSTAEKNNEEEKKNDPGIKTAESYKNMGIGDIGVIKDIYIGLSYVKRMTYLPTSLGPHNEIGDNHEVILAFFDFYNNADKNSKINPEDISCYADGTQVEDVKSYIKVVCDGVSQYYNEEIAEHTQMISVQDFEVPIGWKELKFFYKSECVWTVKQDDVKTEDFTFKSMYSNLVVKRDVTKEGTAIYNEKYEIVFEGIEDYVYNNVIYGDEPYIIFKFKINNTGESAIDYSSAGHNMSAYENNYFLGDATYTMDDKIDGYINVFNVDSIEAGMTANVYVAFKSSGEKHDLYMIYDDGYIFDSYKGYVFYER